MSCEESRRKERDDAGIRRAGVLPGTEDVEVANGNGLQPVETREHQAILLANQLLQRVRRKRIGRHRFVLGQRRGVAVNRRRTCEDDALDARTTSRQKDIERGIDVRAMRGQRIGDRPRHRGDRCLMQHVFHVSDGALGKRHVGQIASQKLDTFDMSQVLTLARDEAVGDTDLVTASTKFLAEMRPYETGAAGHEVRSHRCSLTENRAREVGWVTP